MTAYLDLYKDRWKAILKPEDHEHEIGEPTEDCVNCRLAEIESRFSAFEVGVWNWYFENVNRFALETGIVAGEFQRTAPVGQFRKMVLTGLNEIYLALQDVMGERAQTDKE